MKITTYRWVCTNKEQCEVIDESMAELSTHLTRLSSYRANEDITGLQCVSLEAKFNWALRELKAERKKLWLRVKREVEEEIKSE